jgi:hypothetical protein
MSSTKQALPKAAQTYYQELLGGTVGKDAGLISLRDLLSNALSGMQNTTRDQSSPDPTLESSPNSNSPSNDTRRKLASVKRTVDYLDGIINRVNLFKTHDEMPNLYSLLLVELTDEKQWRAFLSSALRANNDTDSHREMVKESKNLADEITITAGKLADQIDQMYKIELDNMPEEFFSLWHLLNETNDSDWTKNRFSKWCEEKNAIMGETHLSPKPPMSSESVDHASPAYDLIMDDLNESLARIRNTSQRLEDPIMDLHSAWTAVPPVQTILRTLENSASRFSGSRTGMIGQAINSKKANKKTEYIRSLAYFLTQEHQIPLSINIKKAIAIAATVILSGLDITTAYDDVRKALD